MGRFNSQLLDDVTPPPSLHLALTGVETLYSAAQEMEARCRFDRSDTNATAGHAPA